MPLDRFVKAQEHAYSVALAEIQKGRKRTHWMWFIFPQIAGLGYSDMAKFYAITDMDEAATYLNHPVLGVRLAEISKALLALPGSNATLIMGSPDDLKLKSSMTLFALVPGAEPVFQAVLDQFYKGEKDAATLNLIK